MSPLAIGGPRELPGRDQRLALAVADEIARYRGGSDVRVVSLPEEEDRTNPAVELETADEIGHLVIEHTTIEPFTGQVGENHRIRPYGEALTSRLAGRLPNVSRFEINLDVGAVDGARPTQAVLAAIGTWVREPASTLVDGRPGIDGAHMVRSGPPDVPIRMTLTRWPSSPDSPIHALTVGRWVLVIESADISLSNAVDIRHRPSSGGRRVPRGPAGVDRALGSARLPSGSVCWVRSSPRHCARHRYTPRRARALPARVTTVGLPM